MATHKSAEKRARQSIRRSARNSQTLGAVKTSEKKLKAAIASKNAKNALEVLREYTSTAAKAAQKGALNFKTASRKISRLATQVSLIK